MNKSSNNTSNGCYNHKLANMVARKYRNEKHYRNYEKIKGDFFSIAIIQVFREEKLKGIFGTLGNFKNVIGQTFAKRKKEFLDKYKEILEILEKCDITTKENEVEMEIVNAKRGVRKNESQQLEIQFA